MQAALAGVIGATWLGILTSISPCPLATNVAAAAFIGKHVGRTWALVLAGASYTLGRAVAYAGLAFLIIRGLMAVPALSYVLQRYLNQLVALLLILVGMFLLDLIRLRVGTVVGGEGIRERAARGGVLGAALLGALFALSFCPVSAALYFGSLIPMALSYNAPIILPFLFGIGTGLPVMGVACLIGTGGGKLAAVLQRVGTAELWARRATGIVFVGVGLYMTIRRILMA